MDTDDRDSLERRVEQLEQIVTQLSSTIEELAFQLTQHGLTKPQKHIEDTAPTATTPDFQVEKETPTAAAPIPEPERKPVPPPPPSKQYDIPLRQTKNLDEYKPKSSQIKIPEKMKSGEYWLNRVGIGLLLFGVLFLFKYSIDQGWITPELRVWFGVAVGVALLVIGLRIYPKRIAFANVLLGGGIATWYITGFASFQILDVLSHTAAFAFMATVTIIAFALSLKQNETVLSLIAVLGGFGTPFLLYSSQGNLPGLVLYICLLITLSISIYFYKGWKSVLWVTSVFGWLIFFIGFLGTLGGNNYGLETERASLQAGLIFGWFAFWAVPLIRELVWEKNPNRWVKPTIGFADKNISTNLKDILDRHLHLLAISSPMIGLGLSRITWPLQSSEFFGWIAMGISIVYVLVSHFLQRRESFKSLAYTHAAVALLLFTIALALILEGNTLLIALATEATILLFVARNINDRFVSAAAFILHFLTALWLLDRFTYQSYQAGSFFDAQTMTDLWVIFTYFIAAFRLEQAEAKNLYRLVGFGALTSLFLLELNGNIELFAISSTAFFLFVCGRSVKNKALEFGAYIIFIVVALLLPDRLMDERASGWPILNWMTTIDIWTVFLVAIVSGTASSLAARRLHLAGLLVFIAFIVCREFGQNIQWMIIAFEAIIVALLGRASKDQIIRAYAHILFFAIASNLYYRMAGTLADPSLIPILNGYAIANLWMIITVAGTSFVLLEETEKNFYRFGAHIAMLGWMAFELARLTNGYGWVSAGWGIYGALLLIAGLRLNIYRLRMVALATLMLLVVKMFLIDLAQLETIWRVLLFIGVGAVFLLLSYFFRSLWKKSDDKSNDEIKQTFDES